MKLATALRSFCLFCGLGIFIIYLLQATWSQFYKKNSLLLTKRANKLARLSLGIIYSQLTFGPTLLGYLFRA